MALLIQLLGSPSLVDDDGPRTLPRGRKAWALIAYLLCTGRPASREHLAELLFADADDPLGALRWNLAEVRRRLGAECVTTANGVGLALPPGAVADVDVLRSGSWTEATALPGLGRELLEGMDFSTAVGFDAWLQVERSRMRGVAEAALREAALAHLATGRADRAAAAAARLVALNPFDENFHELLVRSHARSGDAPAATRAAQACAALFERELGRPPGPAVAAAARDLERISVTPPPGAASARAQLEAGRSAVDAGAVEAGIGALRGAAAAAHGCGDDALLARALLALGEALVHAVKGRDEEGAAALRRAALVAQRCGRPELAVTACRELAYVDVLCGRYERALGLLERIRPQAADPAERSAIDSVSGMALSDTARYAEATEHLRRAVACAEQAGATRRLAYALSMLGRLEALRGEHDAARATLTRSLRLTEDDNWIGFVVWPEALLAEVELAQGEQAAAADRFAHAFALGCHLEDPCWEGLAARGLALLEAGNDPATAIDRLDSARIRALGAPDGYRWVGAHALDALCSTAVRAGDERAPAWVAELRSLAAATGMRELAVHAYLHEAALGLPGAGEAARALAEEVDNPLLHRRCRVAAQPSHARSHAAARGSAP